MADIKKVATRDAWGSALVELAEKRDDFVVLDADLAAATKTGMFKKACPDRFYDCGIAEQNMMGIAAGIAATGKRVAASSFAMFAAGRAFEQIRNSIAYPHLPVVIGATHAGISVGEDGATHQCCEDIAVMRTCLLGAGRGSYRCFIAVARCRYLACLDCIAARAAARFIAFFRAGRRSY
ncbi:MAG: hypothetical protein MJ132_04275, partial [Clostridia bacterium]|nr:hypothetical protein [Clostridia bacterium]